MPRKRPTPDDGGTALAGLAAGLDRVWALLAAAVDDRAAALRCPVVATGGTGGVDARVMVLRGVDRAAGTLVFFTDARAPKVAAITADPCVMVVGYDPVRRLQLRLGGTATIARDGVDIDAAWATLPQGSRGDYGAAAAPGEPVDAPGGQAAPVDSRAAFACLMVTVATLDVLELGDEHRRAVYRRSGDEWRGEWCAP